ncbi:hypothetical protein EDI_096940 [Entamoeba dispar SAW760]|uniref:Uncharacterized protein n=1 Tax=Entamoeba dispar (strain ATCC PRA-260 / SAW760) TaxID=370354 RepID=B0EBC0_ENTDS|nr:uncharacterized protein EDI_096940 [Entamoeba dispar SAW760]EDR28171.1 hypothetical protein EDI_096940 [Entamoeba dispar SAW760]|eukprot:EDR28171.1 hypothetical protein EDI_096940 [Entamoeba dispar SAW760]
MADEIPTDRFCCIVDCTNQGNIPLKEVEGTFQIKNELVNTRPIKWKLCDVHFNSAIEKMGCCITGCNEKASTFTLPGYEVHQKDDKVAHNHICLKHHFQMTKSILKPIKRESEEPDQKELPLKKRSNDNSDTITDDTITTEYQNGTIVEKKSIKKEMIEDRSTLKSEESKKTITPINQTENNKSTQTINDKKGNFDIKKCCFSYCNETAIGTLKFIHPLQIPVCCTHQKIITKLLRKALLDQQIVLSTSTTEMIASCSSIHFHPLSNYKKTGNDGRCALCFGYNNKKPIYICSSCSNVFCAECQRVIADITKTNIQQPSTHWKCCVCCTKGIREREDVLRREVIIVREAASKRLNVFIQKEGKQVQEKIQQERERRIEKIEKRKKQIKRIIKWLDTIFPKAVQLRWAITDCTLENGSGEGCLFVFSKTQTNYFISHQPITGETLIETLYSVAGSTNKRVIKEVDKTIPLEKLLLVHSKEYVDILKEIFNQQDERTTTIKHYLNTFLSEQSFQNTPCCLAAFYLRVSLEIAQGVCESLEFLSKNKSIKFAYIFTGAKGGVVPYQGVLEKKEGGKTEDSKIVIKLTPDVKVNEQSRPIVMIMKKNPMEFPNGIQAKVSADVITSSYFINYIGLGVKYVLRVIGIKKIAVVVLGELDTERGTIEILKEEIKNKEVLIVKSGEEWVETAFKLRMFSPEILFLSFHCEICNSSTSVDTRVKKVAKDIMKMTKITKTDDVVTSPCQIVTLFQHGIVQDVNYEKYRSAIKLFIESLNNDF